MTVATTMNVRVVAYMKPAAQAWVHPIARAYSAAGTPRTTSIATRNTRHENDRPGTGGQCGYVQAGAGAHDEHRDQEPEADRFELDLELGRCTTISVSLGTTQIINPGLAVPHRAKPFPSSPSPAPARA